MTELAHRLLIQSGPQSGREFPLSGSSITIGRYPLADIVIDDPEVAYRHAVITRGDSTYRIADLGSDAGTYVNGQRIGAEPVPLAHGDIILLGPQLSVAYLSTINMAIENVAGPEPDADLPREAPPPAAEWAAADQPVANEYDAPLWDEPVVAGKPGAAPAGEPVASTLSTHPDPLPSLPPPHKRNGRIMLITAVLLLVLLACCCSATLFMYFIGGDWLLNQMGYLP